MFDWDIFFISIVARSVPYCCQSKQIDRVYLMSIVTVVPWSSQWWSTLPPLSPPCGHDNVASTYIFVYVIVRVKLWRKIALNNSFYKTTIFAHFLRSFNSYLLYHCKITLCLRLTRVSRTFILLDYPGGR